MTRRERRTALAWTCAWELARRLPAPLAFAPADLVAWIAYRMATRMRSAVRGNLARVVPEEDLPEATRQAFRSYARYWVESFRATSLDAEDVDRRTSTGGFEHLDAVLEQGRGVIVLLAHHGSWDIAARWAETHGYHLAVVAEVLRPRALFERWVRLREAIGLEVVPLRRGEQVVARLGKVLADNHLVGLLSDRDLSGQAPLARLFGEPCRIPPGAAVLSKRHRAAIVPITMLQRPRGRWHLQVLPPIDVSALNLADAQQAVAGGIEALIRLDPVQWHAFQPMFESDRASGRSPHRSGAGGP